MLYAILEVSSILFETVTSFMFLEYFLKWKRQSTKLIAKTIFFILVFISNLVIKIPINTVVISLIILYIISAFFSDRLKRKTLVIISYMTLVLVSELITVVIMLLGNSSVSEMLEDGNVQRILGIVISKIVVLFLIRIVKLFSNKQENKIYFNYWVALLTVPAVNLFMLMIITAFLHEVDKFNSIPVLFAVISIMYITLIVFYLFDKIVELSGNNLLLEKQVAIQSEYSEVECEQIENIKIIKHDFINHLQVIYKMLHYNDVDKTRDYIIKLNIINDIDNNSIDTGNVSLDSVLSSKIKLAESEKIQVDTKIVIPENLPIDSVDECILFGNLIDNAIEACKDAKDTDKRININIVYKHCYILINISNTMSKPIKIKKNRLVTSKFEKNEHGIGMKSINKIIKKYNGICKLYIKNQMFYSEIILFVD